ncbi:MAG: hypothetical protein COA78_19560 [Blastopirellula sp.]|nr:MAG: hypothetical protein COA78_19560 [Blastopirellula sp.]
MNDTCPVCKETSIHETHFACHQCISRIIDSSGSEYSEYLTVICRSIFNGIAESKVEAYVNSFIEKFHFSIVSDQLYKLKTLLMINDLSGLKYEGTGDALFEEYCHEADQPNANVGEVKNRVGHKGLALVPFVHHFQKLDFLLYIQDFTSIAWYLLGLNRKYKQFLHENLSEGDCAIDCGAHHGFYSLSIAKKVGSTGKVIAIEGDPYNYAILCENIKLNNATNIIPVHAIVSDESDNELQFQGDSVREGNLREAYFESTSVKTVKIDDFIKENPAYLKIDIEGYELMALKGSGQILKKLKPKMDLSIHLYGVDQPDMRNFGCKPTEVLDVLQANGYDLGDDFTQRLSDDNCAPCGYDIKL